MQIIKMNDNQEKVTYEIYEMQLNQEKMINYRKEQAKNIQFFRLNVGLPFESDFIEKVSSYQQTKTICELTEIPIDDKKVIYGDVFDPNLFSMLTLAPYCKTNFANDASIIKNGNQQQKEFLEDFIECGLTKYYLNPRSEWELNSYIFLNPFINCSQFGTYGYSDNFIFLPHSIMALEITLYLLKNSLPIDSLFYYTDFIVDPKVRISFSENFLFSKEKTLTEEEFEVLKNSDMFQKEELTRKIKLGSALGYYIK